MHNLRPQIEEMLTKEFNDLVTVHTDARTGVIEYDKIIEMTASMMPLEDTVVQEIKGADPLDVPGILSEYSRQLYDAREAQFGAMVCGSWSDWSIYRYSTVFGLNIWRPWTACATALACAPSGSATLL